MSISILVERAECGCVDFMVNGTRHARIGKDRSLFIGDGFGNIVGGVHPDLLAEIVNQCLLLEAEDDK